MPALRKAATVNLIALVAQVHAKRESAAGGGSLVAVTDD